MDSLARDLHYDPVIVLAHVRAFRLGGVDVRPATREIVAPNGREVLEPKVIQVLVALARAEGEFLTRDDLIASCWDGRVVGEDAITRVISRLRRVTETLGQGSWTLETVTKVGYRLVTSEPMERPAPEHIPAAVRPDRRVLLFGGGAAGVAALGGGAAWWTLRRHGPSRDVLELIRKAEDAMEMGQPDQSAQAIGFMRQATTEAPDYAQGWAMLGQAYRASLTFTPPERQPGVQALAQAAARRALDLDPKNYDAAALLMLSEPVFGNWLKAERTTTWALGLHQRQGGAHGGYAMFLLSVGRAREAVPYAQRAVELERLAPWRRVSLGEALSASGRIEEAERSLREALALWPRHHAIWFNLFYLLTFTGRADQALAMGGDLPGRPPNIPAADMELSLVGARGVQGLSAAARSQAITAYRAAARDGVGYAENAVGFLATLGDLDGAFAVARAMYLNEGFRISDRRWSHEQGRYNLPGQRNTELLFQPSAATLRADPRFLALLRDIGLVDYWRRSGHAPDDRRWMTA